MSKLALLGGKKEINYTFSPYNFIGEEEIQAVNEVMKTGVLSGYVGSWTENFYGGQYVRNFEKNWADYFGVKHAVAVNSNTSGLIVALGALGIEPGDEVIVSTWSMCASATAILVWNAIPVFCDIESDTFNMDPTKIEALITPSTKAILVPHIFGHAAALDSIKKIAKKHSLFIIEDCAQVPGAYYKGRLAGTVADIGVYSLNYHKHIHTGEGGVCVTNNCNLAERMQLIRNHAEAVVGDKKVENLANMIGFNFRLTELQAAIGTEQLKKLKRTIEYRVNCANRLSSGLKDLPGIRLPIVKFDCTHVYYTFPLIYDSSVSGISRKLIIDALKAEGFFDIAGGYVNIHCYPMYQKKIAYGRYGFPWTADFYKGSVSYQKGICPLAESLHEKTFINILLCLNFFNEKDLDLIIKVFHKVWEALPELKKYKFSQNETKSTHCIS